MAKFLFLYSFPHDDSHFLNVLTSYSILDKLIHSELGHGYLSNELWKVEYFVGIWIGAHLH